MKDNERRAAAKAFADYWKDKGYEKGESQKFWLELLQNVYGVQNPGHFIEFESQVMMDHTSFIDGYIDDTKVLIEQKSSGKNLRKAIKQSDGSMLTPFQQAKRYIVDLPVDKHPRWVITCNFQQFLIYDMNKPNGEPEEILLKDLPKEYYRLDFVVDSRNVHVQKEMEVSIQAGELVGKLYDTLLKQYADQDDPEALKSLNMLCVRLVFCLYAEDAGIFGRRGMFHDYMQQFPTKQWRKNLIELFQVLDTPEDERDKYMEEDLAAFPYVNGGLFADEEIEIPNFTDEIIDLILNQSSRDFDWSLISPTIFGACFESTLNPETRRSGGMHYTSIENIHKVIDPLFLDDLKDELHGIKEVKIIKTRDAKLKAFQDKLASLTFFDPACGSGNFCTETYLSLRKLENEILSELYGDQIVLGDLGAGSPIKVQISQFYGIEINDFAVKVAKTALWIAESQMMKKTEDIVHMDLDFLPLKSYVNITKGNALTLPWESVVNPKELSYLISNPPFLGARLMNSQQKNDLKTVLDGWKNIGNLDYVTGWYKKASDYMTGTKIKAALVSTNSISQGEQVALLWKPLFTEGVHIDFAHRTFRWDSEANLKAHVHCVIIGFSKGLSTSNKVIYADDRPLIVNNINGYLIDAEDIFIESRTKPICDVPQIGMGNQPIDDGNYLFSEDEMKDFLNKEPASKEWFKPWYGAQEFIKNVPRYCLWLGECPPNDLVKMPECMKRIDAVRQFRLSSKRASTLKLAETPTRFQTENMPKGHYIVIPEVSSERRRYIPMGYMDDSVLCSNKLRLMPNAELYHFGILESNVHMAWMRTVCGRMKSDYDYSIKIVYNNFPWPNPTNSQKEKIEATAQAILDARAKYPESSLADMYGEHMYLYPELMNAHRANDRAVMEAYGFWGKLNTESECVAELMKMYQALTEQK